ncbi:hypothetical protein WJX72_012532 [[Myrmecia] bisecta]|uniref:Uncharacterized protein n=1 Tax=[Myrmecia] bisecta TaxID=41462 RepID=A0AAW1RBI8_9CHLO
MLLARPGCWFSTAGTGKAQAPAFKPFGRTRPGQQAIPFSLSRKPGRPAKQAIRADSHEEARGSAAAADVHHPGTALPAEGMAGAGLSLPEHAKRQRALRRALVREAFDLWMHRIYLLLSRALVVLLVEFLLAKAGQRRRYARAQVGQAAAPHQDVLREIRQAVKQGLLVVGQRSVV